MLRAFLISAVVLLALSPAGAGVGVWLAMSVGWGVCVGSVGYGALGVFVLTADLLPGQSKQPVEAVR